MHAIVPKLVSKRSPPSLFKLCLRVVSSLSCDVSRLPWQLGEALLEECQARFALEDGAGLERFFCVPLRRWRARERFLEHEALFDAAVRAWSPTLTSLELWSVHLSAECLSSLTSRLPHLVALSLLRVPGLDDDVARSIFSEALCARLEFLSFAELSQVSDKGLAALSLHCKSLRTLRVEHCHVSVESVCRCAGAALQELCFEADDALAKVLFESCPSLRVLDFRHGDVTDRGMRPLLGALAPKLLKLSLSHTAVSCASLEAFRVADDVELPLMHLDLSLLYNVTKEAVEDLLYCCPNLIFLSLKDNDEVDDATVEVLCTCCPRLRELNLSKCNLITDAGLAQIVADLTDLTSLDVRKCDQLSERMRAFVSKLQMKVQV
jgi:hypothetical protein